MKPKAVFFDFDGVLSRDRFYSTLAKDYPQVCEYVDNIIFRGDQKIADRWMRGEFTYQQINQMIADATNIPFELINRQFIESVRAFRLEDELIQFARALVESGVPVALVTNNMDIFNEVTIPTHNLTSIFKVIVNSTDHGTMKHEQNGKLFDIALAQLGLVSFNGVILIDDSEKACNMFESKGGTVHRFKEMEGFREWKTNEGFVSNITLS